MRAILMAAVLALPLAAQQPLADRIAHNDPSRYRAAKSVHGGAGELHYMGMFDGHSLDTNLLFLHRGLLQPHSSIGHHFHNKMEEMFVILNGEAEFTINGRTSLLQGPVGAPCRMGSSHAIYNPTDEPVEWMNIAVGTVKDKYDNFDLGDPRVGVALDEIPVFITLRLDRDGLRPMQGADGVRYRRALNDDVFTTNWSHVDHMLLDSGASTAGERHREVAEFYYVMSGAGTARVGRESAAIQKGDAVPVQLNEQHSFENTGSEPLEFLVVGVSRRKGVID